MEFIYENSLAGLLIGICTFLVIGAFHPIVIKSEYYFGTKCWWVFLLAGLIGVVLSIMIKDILLSTVIGVVAFSCFWSILELFEQRQRVLKGWFPMNPKRAKDYQQK